MSDEVYKWKICPYGISAVKVRVIKETDKMIRYESIPLKSYGPDYEHKKNNFFDTFKEAKAELVKRKEDQLFYRKKAVKYAMDELTKAVHLEKPE